MICYLGALKITRFMGNSENNIFQKMPEFPVRITF